MKTSLHCTESRFSHAQAKRRRGNFSALMGFTLPVLAMLAAFSINLAHMQLTRTELIVATDAAAKASGRAFSEMQTVSDAKTAGRVTAAMKHGQRRAVDGTRR